MIAQYLVRLGATTSRKSKRNDKAAILPQASKERTFHFHMLVKSLCIIAQKCISRQCFNFSLVLNLFLFFPQILGSCSYEIVLIKKKCIFQHSKLLSQPKMNKKCISTCRISQVTSHPRAHFQLFA